MGSQPSDGLSTGGLIRLGFANPATVQQLVSLHPELAEVLATLSSTADPDLALNQLARWQESGHSVSGAYRELTQTQWNHLVHLLGGSRPLGDFLVSGESLVIDSVDPDPRATLLGAVGANPTDKRPQVKLETTGAMDEAIGALRSKYRLLLTQIAAADLSRLDPAAEVAKVSAQLARLADGALEAALSIARGAHDPQGEVDLAVIALGKAGAEELNYISDVDVMFLAAPDSTDQQLQVAGQMAVALTAICSAPGVQAPLWTLDAGLRPEGRDGALVRTVTSALDYYCRWAENWEFQALMKARMAAGDQATAEVFLREVEPLIWSAASRPGFVAGAQSMRRQVERSVRDADRGRELKLSAGGLRDIEFTVQLLQLVHGQTSVQVRVANTLAAIAALTQAGFISRDQALQLTQFYQFLRLVEHRVQLQGMRRTHTLPSVPQALRSLARSIDPRRYPSAEALETYLAGVRKQVRALHEDVFYRPIVAASATLGTPAAGLETADAEDRLRTIGYLDPLGALRAIEALTKGTSRRAMIQRNLAPVIVQWLSEGTDPDLGIQGFRTLSEQIGSSHWYLSLLRDSGSAARRLCQILSNSRWAQAAFSSIPRAVSWLDSDRLLAPRPKAELAEEANAVLGRHQQSDAAMRRVASIVTREVTRAGLDDLSGGVQAWRTSIADVIDVAVDAALRLALREEETTNGPLPIWVAAIGMGRYGGSESTYASDIDLMFVHQEVNSPDSAAPGHVDSPAGEGAACSANRVAQRTRELLVMFKQQGMTDIDLDLRPEGKQGALVRSLDSYRSYYQRWSSPWERQALVRARFVGGDARVGAAFMEMADEVRWGHELTEKEIREIRLLKARMERERLPRGGEPQTHVKLGPGGLSDVEWTVQYLQLSGGHSLGSLRLGSTLPAIEALVEAEIIEPDEGEDLSRAWRLASRIRSANVLATNRLQPERVDAVPRASRGGRAVATLLGYGAGGEGDLLEQWLFASRRARAVMDKYFWA